MSSIITKIPSKSILRQLFFLAHRAPLLIRPLCTSTVARTQELERIAGELLSLTKLERHDFAILLRYELALNRYGPAVSGLCDPSSGAAAFGAGAGSADAKATEKTTFDVKLETFDPSAKLKVIKEIRAITGLGLKEAKDVVEKAPSVVKEGVTKEEADAIIEKLKTVDATLKIALE